MPVKEWFFYDSGSDHPFINMGRDEALLLHGPSSSLVLRFYAWDPPGLSLGYFQKYSEMEERCDRLGCGAVMTRRITGGDAILHIHELTFTLTGPEGIPPFDASVESSYHRIHEAVALGLESLGISSALRDPGAGDEGSPDPAGRCFYRVTSFDLVAGGWKLVGSAQRRTLGRVLHHGSLPLKPNPMTTEAADCTTLAGRAVSYQDAARALCPAFENTFGVHLRAWEPASVVLDEGERLARDKYGDKDWIQRR